MKNQNVFKVVVCVLCITMFTACGKRDSKRRNAGLGANHAGGAKQKVDPVDGDRNNIDDLLAETSTDTPSARNSDDQDIKIENIPTPAPELAPDSETIPDETDAGDPDVNSDGQMDIGDGTPSDSSDSSSDTTTTRIVRVDTPSAGDDNSRPAGNGQSTQQQTDDGFNHINFFMKKYNDVPYDETSPMLEKNWTGYQTDSENSFNYTDLKDDGIMPALKSLWEQDMIGRDETIQSQSEELAQAIAHIYPTLGEDNHVDVVIKIRTDLKPDDGAQLTFSGKINEQGRARLHSNKNLEGLRYVVDLVCLDGIEACNTHQVVLSAFYTVDDPNLGQKKGHLCKRAYAVSRMGNVTVNLEREILQKYVHQKGACEGADINSPENSVVCFAALAYNTWVQNKNNWCKNESDNTNNTHLRCLEYANQPTGYRAKDFHMHTFAVAGGEAKFIASFKDSNESYASYSGPLVVPHQQSVALDKGHLNIRRDSDFASSSLNTHLTKASLNGIDSNGSLQIELNYNKLSEDKNINIDIIPRFSKIDLDLLQVEFPFDLPSDSRNDDDHDRGDDDRNHDDDQASDNGDGEFYYGTLITHKLIDEYVEKCAEHPDTYENHNWLVKGFQKVVGGKSPFRDCVTEYGRQEYEYGPLAKLGYDEYGKRAPIINEQLGFTFDEPRSKYFVDQE